MTVKALWHREDLRLLLLLLPLLLGKLLLPPLLRLVLQVVPGLLFD
jgi:hypothetical protein